MEDEKFEELLENIMETLGIEEDEITLLHVVDGTLTDTPAFYWETIH